MAQRAQFGQHPFKAGEPVDDAAGDPHAVGVAHARCSPALRTPPSVATHWNAYSWRRVSLRIYSKPYRRAGLSTRICCWIFGSSVN